MVPLTSQLNGISADAGIWGGMARVLAEFYRTDQGALTGSVQATLTIRNKATSAVLVTAEIQISASYAGSFAAPNKPLKVNSWSIQTSVAAPVKFATGNYPAIFPAAYNYIINTARIWGAGFVLEVGAAAENTNSGSGIPALGIETVEHIEGSITPGWGLSAGSQTSTTVIARPYSTTQAYSEGSKEYDIGRIYQNSLYDAVSGGPDSSGGPDPISPIVAFYWQPDPGQGLLYDTANGGREARVLFPGQSRSTSTAAFVPYTGILTVVAENGSWDRKPWTYQYIVPRGGTHFLANGRTCRIYNSGNDTTVARLGLAEKTLLRERYPTLRMAGMVGYLLTQDAVTGKWKLRISDDLLKTLPSDTVEPFDENFKNATFCLLSNGGAAAIAIEINTNPAKLWFRRSPDPLVWDAATAAVRGFALPAPVLIGTMNYTNHIFTIEQATVNGSTQLIVSCGAGTNMTKSSWISDDLGATWK